MARSTVRETLQRAESAGVSWPLAEGMNDGALDAALYANRRSKRGHRRVAERYGRRSTVITSQLPVDRWHEIIGDPTYADAILDRLVHNAHRIELTGESLRRTRTKQTIKA
jgi:hypothetical protein